MRKTLLFSLFFYSLNLSVFSQELANPTPNLQSLPGGSYIIAMDNTWQVYERPNPQKKYFNLKAYGLVVHLLNNNVKVKRIIKSGKAKDALDFTAPSVMVKPTIEGTSTNRNFAGGPFVIMAADAFNIDIERLIENFNNNAAGVSGITDPDYKVKVYKTTTAIFNVDVRHDLTGFIPKACILNDGGNATIHQNFMQLAGIPSTNYLTSLNTDLTVNCFTFASEPHNGAPNATLVSNIKNFVQAGGNFLAQCDAINSYEVLGKFQTTNGFTVTNSNPSVIYPNADIGYAQFEDVFSIKQGGSVQNWILAGGSSFINGTTQVATGSSSVPIGASISKITATGTLGGYVFYLGNHSYSSITDYNQINGIRMYMNAFLTPAYTQGLLNYQYSLNCSNNVLQVSASSGPSVSYPITFRLYADNGSQPGAIDGGDAYIGITQVNSSGGVSTIFIGSTYASQPLLLQIMPGISCFSTITVSPNTCSFAVLPVQMKSIDVTRMNSNLVSITWESQTENGISGYKIWRKNGSLNWEAAGYISSGAIQNNGVYNLKDENNFIGKTLYQLEAIAFDGRSKFSEIKLVDNQRVNPIFIYPNPSFNGKAMLKFDDSNVKDLVIYDISGRKIRMIKNISSPLSLNNLPSGILSISLYNGQGLELYQKKILVK